MSRAAFDRIPAQLERRLYPVFAFLRDYHSYEVVGVENVPKDGPALLVFTHSLATYDIVLLGGTIYYERGRVISALVDRLVMKTPVLNRVVKDLHAVVGEPGVAQELLAEGRLVGVAPGGMREALRPSERRYGIDWERRYGFARLALEAQVPVVLAACPQADDLYTVVDNRLTRFVYDKLRMPLPVAFGVALSPLPRPIKLTHHLSPPITPPPFDGTDEEVRAFQALLVEQMQETIDTALQAAR